MDANQRPMTAEQFDELLKIAAMPHLCGVSLRPNSKSWRNLSTLSVIEACELLCGMKALHVAKMPGYDLDRDGQRSYTQIKFHAVIKRIAIANLEVDLEYSQSLNELIQDDEVELAILRIKQSNAKREFIEMSELEKFLNGRHPDVMKVKTFKGNGPLVTSVAKYFGGTTARTARDSLAKLEKNLRLREFRGFLGS